MLLFYQVGTEMAHQLYVMQTLSLGLLEQRMNAKMDVQVGLALAILLTVKFNELRPAT